MIKWLSSWIAAIIKSFKLIRKYGVEGAMVHIAEEQRQLRMQYFKQTGKPWKDK